MALTSQSQPLLGKIALVTGSSRGIGAAIARKLASDGASVIINYLTNETAANQLVASLIANRPNSAVAIKADVSSVEQAKYLWEESVKAFPRADTSAGGVGSNFGGVGGAGAGTGQGQRRIPDIIVLNAGIMGSETLSEIDEQFYDRHFNSNVKGPLFLVKEAAPSLAPGSRIIFFSSSLAHASMVPATALVYAASKGAIEQITRILAKDLGTRSITVNCIAPGPIDTDLFHAGKTEQQIGFFTNLHPGKRIGAPEEVASVVAFLVGPSSSWVNGQVIMVNGAFVV